MYLRMKHAGEEIACMYCFTYKVKIRKEIAIWEISLIERNAC